MYKRVAIVYNEPQPSGYDDTHEEKAVLGVLDAVNAVREAMVELGRNVITVPLLPPIEEARKKLAALDVDVVFNLFIRILFGFHLPYPDALLRRNRRTRRQ